MSARLVHLWVQAQRLHPRALPDPLLAPAPEELVPAKVELANPQSMARLLQQEAVQSADLLLAKQQQEQTGKVQMQLLLRDLQRHEQHCASACSWARGRHPRRAAAPAHRLAAAHL